jgi:predicted  nucleic acid-binding Zn-ribbon protein
MLYLILIVSFFIQYICRIRSETHSICTERNHLLAYLTSLTTSHASIADQLDAAEISRDSLLAELDTTQLDLTRARSDQDDGETNLEIAQCRAKELEDQVWKLEAQHAKMQLRMKRLGRDVEMGMKCLAPKTHDLAVAEDRWVKEQCEVNQHCIASRMKLSTANAQAKSLRRGLADSNAALGKAVRQLEKSKRKRRDLETRVEGLELDVQVERQERQGLARRNWEFDEMVGGLDIVVEVLGEYVDESEEE